MGDIMLKLKYYSLTKEEKKKLKEEFYMTEFGQVINSRLNRLLYTGIMGLIFSLYLLLFNSNKVDTIIGIVLVIASVTFIIGSFKIRTQKINNYLVSKKKK